MAAKRLSAGALLTALLALFAGVGEGPAPAAAPPPTAAVKEKVRQRDRLVEEAKALGEARKWGEGIAAWRKVLALEKDLYGPEHDEVLETLEVLAVLCTAHGDWAGAV